MRKLTLLTRECQKLADQWLFKTAETQGTFSVQPKIPSDKNSDYGKPDIQNEYDITEAQILRYQQLRESIGQTIC